MDEFDRALRVQPVAGPDRTFTVQMSCPRPPRPSHLKREHHQDLIERTIVRLNGLAQGPGVALTLGMTARTARITCTIPAHSAAEALERAEHLLRAFLQAASFRIPSPLPGQPARPKGPVRATITELPAT